MKQSVCNRELKSLQHTLPAVLEGYIDNIRSRYGVHLNFHDLCGISRISQELEKVLAPYLYHNNSFCNAVKKTDSGFKQCIESKSRLCRFCGTRQNSFYGRCSLGAEEFVFPVFWRGKLLALICAGPFVSEEGRTLKRIAKSAEMLGVDAEKLVERYLGIARKIDFPLRDFFYDMGLLIQLLAQIYFSFAYEARCKSGGSLNEGQLLENHKSIYIIDRAVLFIKENYSRDLTLADIAANCYCNASYLSRHFKEKLGLGIVEYIHQIRVEAAKEILDITVKPVTEVGMMVGYNDSGYFSKVFKQYTSWSPSEYRKRKT